MRKIICNNETGDESSHASMGGGGLRQFAANKIISDKGFIETLKLLLQTKHSMLLKCVLDILSVICPMYLFNYFRISLPESDFDFQFVETLLQALEDYDEEYFKSMSSFILFQLLEKPTIQSIFQQYNGTKIVIK